jgi:hypothetical protein
MTAQQQKYETVNNIAVLFLASTYDRLFRDLKRPTSAARSNLVFFGRNSEPGIHELAGSPGLDLKFDPDLYAMFTRVLPYLKTVGLASNSQCTETETAMSRTLYLLLTYMLSCFGKQSSKRGVRGFSKTTIGRSQRLSIRGFCPSGYEMY